MSKSAKKILNTAEELFNQHSFTGVGVDLIRDESGCSKTTMYTYFKNKQQLVIAVLKQRDLDFRSSLTNFVGDTLGIEALERIFDWHCDWFQTDHFKGCLFVRAVAESSSQDIEINQISMTHKVWLRGFIQNHIEYLHQDKALGDMIYNLIEGLISRFLVEGFNAQIMQQQKNLMIRLIVTMKSE